MLTIVRVQEKGQVTIPREIRRLLKLKKGDLVTFVNTANGVVIQSLEQAASDLLGKLEKNLAARRIAVDELLAFSQENGGDQVVRKYGLNTEEKAILYQFLQLRAQMAIESIRTEAEVSGSEQLTEDEIGAEIQVARNEAKDADRS
jgi:AbrB family looped-hinge helix DNA binding protein